MSATEPYLSIVVTSRNDDHGGGMLRRMQTFVNALAAQCERHRLPAELIVVEWNPPADRPRLAEALAWPAQPHPCSVRIIEVPEQLHDRFEHGDRLPLFQMIAKNVGIRRSRAPFVLATNIDVILNDELAAFLATRSLQRGRMYRIDRTDVGPDVPPDGTIDAQLGYCRSHLIRLNTRDGVFPLDGRGCRALMPGDIAEESTGCRFDDGWYPPEADETGRFRWVRPRASLLFPDGWTRGHSLYLEVEPGPGVGYAPFELEVRFGAGRSRGFKVERKQTVCVPLGSGVAATGKVDIRCHGRNEVTVANEPRRLAMRVFNVSWSQPASDGSDPAVSRSGGHLNPIQVVRRAAQRLFRRQTRAEPGPAAPSGASAEAVAPVELHFGAPGDFTLMAREHWEAVRGHPELAMYSLHIDTVLCYQAYYAGATEEVLPAPMRLYHIEHGNGSGWTPEGQAELARRLAERCIPVLPGAQAMAWAAEMHRTGAPMRFNNDEWGLGGIDLKETAPQGQKRSAA